MLGVILRPDRQVLFHLRLSLALLEQIQHFEVVHDFKAVEHARVGTHSVQQHAEVK